MVEYILLQDTLPAITGKAAIQATPHLIVITSDAEKLNDTTAHIFHTFTAKFSSSTNDHVQIYKLQ